MAARRRMAGMIDPALGFSRRDYPKRATPPLPFFRSARWCFGLHRLEDLEALELGVSEIKRPVFAGVAVRSSERFRPRPCLEIGPATPDRVRRVKDMIFPLRAAQQVKRREARNVAQMGVACRPDLLEIRLRSGDDFEAVHRDEHDLSSRGRRVHYRRKMYPEADACETLNLPYSHCSYDSS